MKVAVIDYGAGNLLSGTNALRQFGAGPQVVSTPDAIGEATHLILPGVGAFGECMNGVTSRGFADPVR